MRESFALQLGDEGFLRRLNADLDRLDADLSPLVPARGAAVGAGLGGAASFAALYGLGVTGLSSVGVSTGLAAAGALVGGGIAAGVGVLTAPVAALGAVGFAVAGSRRKKRVKALQRDVLAKAITKQGEVLHRLSAADTLTEEEALELRNRAAMLSAVVRQLRAQGSVD